MAGDSCDQPHDGDGPRFSVSVVVVAHEAVEGLRRCLEALAADDQPWREVVVVADGFPRTVAEALERASPPLALTVLEQVHSGTAAARNLGWRACHGMRVLFLDETLVASCGLAAAHLAAAARCPGAVVVGPIVRGGRPPNMWMAYEDRTRAGVYETQAGRRDLRGTPVDGNFSVPRVLLEAVGGFDARLIRGSHTDLTFRLREAGAAFCFAPDAVARTIENKSFEQWATSHRLQGRLDVLIYERSASDGAGVKALVGCLHDRNPLTRFVVGLSLRRRPAESILVEWLAGLAGVAYWLRLGSLSNACLGAAANVIYWRGVSQALRSKDAFRSLVGATRRLKARPY